MPKMPGTAQIVNRNAPILVINETSEPFEFNIQFGLRGNGLVSKVTPLIDLASARVSARYALVVCIINTSSDIPFIADIKTRQNIPQKKIVIDVGLSYSTNHWHKQGIDFFQCENDSDEITDTISRYFKDNVDLSLFEKKDNGRNIKSDNLKDLIQSLETTTDAISDLRVNSTSEVIIELRGIISRLKGSQVQASPDALVTKQNIKQTIYEILHIISKIYDHIDNSRLAAIIVSGATTAIMGCSGLSATVSVSIMLASWHGKDAFIAAVNKMNIGKR